MSASQENIETIWEKPHEADLLSKVQGSVVHSLFKDVRTGRFFIHLTKSSLTAPLSYINC